MKYLSLKRIREIIKDLPDDAFLHISEDGSVYQVIESYNLTTKENNNEC